MDLYFSEKYKDENTLVYIKDNQEIASLQMLTYHFSFYDENIPVSYISGACTLPGFRRHGIMEKLLCASFNVMKQRNIPLSILIPSNENLYKYYEKFGYEKVFEKDDAEIPLKEIWEKSNGDLDAAYQMFNDYFKNKNLCIQKTKSDFRTIIKDAELENFPPKTNLSGMLRVMDANRLISLYEKKNPAAVFENNKQLCHLLFKSHTAILNLMLE